MIKKKVCAWVIAAAMLLGVGTASFPVAVYAGDGGQLGEEAERWPVAEPVSQPNQAGTQLSEPESGGEEWPTIEAEPETEEEIEKEIPGSEALEEGQEQEAAGEDELNSAALLSLPMAAVAKITMTAGSEVKLLDEDVFEVYNGGTLQQTGIFGEETAVAGASGASYTISVETQDARLSGISSSGSVTITGGGTLHIQGADNSSGPVVVNRSNGVLEVNGGTKVHVEVLGNENPGYYVYDYAAVLAFEVVVAGQGTVLSAKTQNLFSGIRAFKRVAVLDGAELYAEGQKSGLMIYLYLNGTSTGTLDIEGAVVTGVTYVETGNVSESFGGCGIKVGSNINVSNNGKLYGRGYRAGINLFGFGGIMRAESGAQVTGVSTGASSIAANYLLQNIVAGIDVNRLAASGQGTYISGTAENEHSIGVWVHPAGSPWVNSLCMEVSDHAVVEGGGTYIGVEGGYSYKEISTGGQVLGHANRYGIYGGNYTISGGGLVEGRGELEGVHVLATVLDGGTLRGVATARQGAGVYTAQGSYTEGVVAQGGTVEGIAYNYGVVTTGTKQFRYGAVTSGLGLPGQTIRVSDGGQVIERYLDAETIGPDYLVPLEDICTINENSNYEFTVNPAPALLDVEPGTHRIAALRSADNTVLVARRQAAAQNEVVKIADASGAGHVIYLPVILKPKKYTLEFNTLGGDPAPESQLLEYSQQAVPPAEAEEPWIKGHSFMGWYRDAALEQEWDFEQDRMPKQDVMLYAGYSVNEYIVTYDFGGYLPAVYTQVKYDSLVPKMENPARENHVFTGWQDENGVLWDYEIRRMPDTNITLRAVWDELPYTVTYLAQGKTVATRQVMAGGLVPEVEAPKVAEFEFQYWAFSGSKWEMQTAVMPRANITLVAVYKEILKPTPPEEEPEKEPGKPEEQEKIPPEPASPETERPAEPGTAPAVRPVAAVSAASEPEPAAQAAADPALQGGETETRDENLDGMEVPLAGREGGNWSLLSLLLAAAGIISGLISLVTLYRYRRRQQNTRISVLLGIGITAVGVVGMILFLLVSDFRLKMVLINSTTLWFVCLFFVQMIMMAAQLNIKKKRQDGDAEL